MLTRTCNEKKMNWRKMRSFVLRKHLNTRRVFISRHDAHSSQDTTRFHLNFHVHRDCWIATLRLSSNSNIAHIWTKSIDFLKNEQRENLDLLTKCRLEEKWKKQTTNQFIDERRTCISHCALTTDFQSSVSFLELFMKTFCHVFDANWLKFAKKCLTKKSRRWRNFESIDQNTKIEIKLILQNNECTSWNFCKKHVKRDWS